MIISPDKFRYDAEGKYDSSREATSRAWDQALALLSQQLNRGVDRPVSLTLLVGIPGSGKSTWANNQPHDGNVIFFDATFTRRLEREPLIAMAKAAVVRVKAIVFLTPIDECLRRNWQRSEDRRVPYFVMTSMLDNLRREPVTIEEGFVQVRRSDAY